ncbi:MAG TPA: Wadjet anti-phage system protein JetD domain-containing protein, partial [Verrucomicrobiae bacterium]|nr:Wadjet anti-phage system protein JetD domain-containing protein [Verrucomicrobiae bacterium]
ELLVQTSYAGSGTLRFLERLPASIQWFHFGDSDPKGFEILQDLRRRTGRPIQSLHMTFRMNGKSPPLDQKETRLLRRLLLDPLMMVEHPALKAMLTASVKGSFEQETLGKPTKPAFPFFEMHDERPT